MGDFGSPRISGRDSLLWNRKILFKSWLELFDLLQSWVWDWRCLDATIIRDSGKHILFIPPKRIILKIYFHFLFLSKLAVDSFPSLFWARTLRNPDVLLWLGCFDHSRLQVIPSVNWPIIDRVSVGAVLDLLLRKNIKGLWNADHIFRIHVVLALIILHLHVAVIHEGRPIFLLIFRLGISDIFLLWWIRLSMVEKLCDGWSVIVPLVIWLWLHNNLKINVSSVNYLNN